ncbi:GapS6b family protein [Escherichia coli]
MNNELHSSHYGSGDIVLGNKITYPSELTPENLFPIAEDIFRKIRNSDIATAKTVIDTLEKLPATPVARKFVDVLNTAILVSENASTPRFDELYTLAKEDDLSDKLRDVVFSVIMLIEFKNNNHENAIAIYSQSPKKKYSHMFYLQCLATEDEINDFWNKNQPLVSEDELYAISIGASRINNQVSAKEFVTLLVERAPTSLNSILLNYITVLELAEKYLNIDLLSLDKDAYDKIINCINDTISFSETYPDNKWLLYSLSNLVMLVKANHYQLIQTIVKYRDKISAINPSVTDFVDMLFSIDETAPLTLRDIKEDDELTSDALIVLIEAAEKGMYIKENIKQLILNADLKKDDHIKNLPFNYQLISLKAKLLLNDSNDHINKKRIKEDLAIFIPLAHKDKTSLSGNGLVNLCDDLLWLDLAKECCDLLEPRLPENLWPSRLVIAYFESLIRAEKLTTLTKCLSSIDKTLWDHYTWIFQARIDIAYNSWPRAIIALEEAIKKNDDNSYPWLLLIRCTLKTAPATAITILDRIPKTVFSSFDAHSLSLLRLISNKVDPHFSEKIISEKFISSPQKFAPILLQTHFSSLTGHQAKKANELNTQYPDNVIRAIKLIRNGVEEEKVILDITPDKEQGALLSAHTEYGDLLANLAIDEEDVYVMDRVKITEELNPYHVIFRYALNIVSEKPDINFPIKKIEVPSDPELLFQKIKDEFSQYDHQSREEHIINCQNVPLYLKANELEKGKPVKSILQLLTSQRVNKSLSLPEGEVDHPEKFITDIHGIIYFALTHADIALRKSRSKLIITNETKTCIDNWLTEVENPSYLSIGVRDDHLFRITAEDIQSSTASIRDSLNNLLDYCEVHSVPVANTPDTLLNVKEFLDTSVYSTMKYVLFTKTPYFIIDDSFSALTKSLDPEIKIVNSIVFTSHLLEHLPLPIKLKNFQCHVETYLPMHISYKDCIALANSDDEKHVALVTKIFQMHSNPFNNFNSLCSFFTHAISLPLFLVYINHYKKRRPLSLDNAIIVLFNTCCQGIVNASDGRTAEERLVAFTKLIVDDHIYPQGFISFVFSIFNLFAQGHFLDINHMNLLINDVEKTEPLEVTSTIVNESSN